MTADLFDNSGIVFDVDTFAVHDGPGIRMAVYLKGCPLHCAWCHSPESQRLMPEVIFVRDRCALCGACMDACDHGGHDVSANGHERHTERCIACGACVEACPNDALDMRGYTVTAREVVARAARMRPFFENSGGGVTLSGGEVTTQTEFAAAILEGCRAEGIHTAVETCGACSWERLERLLPHTDLVLYDLKLMDSAEHRRWTGVGNELILENAERLAAAASRGDVNVRVRVPLIPGVTDTDGNLAAMWDFMRAIGLTDVNLLPYNTSAGAKYEWLDRSYDLQAVAESQAPIRLDALVLQAERCGLRAEIG